MRLLPANSGPGRMLRHSRFTRARLKSNAKAKALVSYLEPAHLALKAAQLAAVEVDDALMDARAPVTEVDTAADEVVVAFQLDLLKQTGKNYSDPHYVAYFPKGLGEVRRLHGQSLAAELSRIEQTLTAQGKTGPLATYIPKFQQLQKEWQGPLAALKKVTENQTQVGIVLDKAKHDWALAYDAIYGHLRALFPGKKTFVESFFLPADAPKKPKPTV